ncbi:uncharacterized protein LOC121424476 isoform X2 [Lytechinus variegatus]|nr:uncharacterized protein LOC121424476 isoform X2 [Lytechinus variegatus]
MAWGCVTGAGPSWEINQPRRPGTGARRKSTSSRKSFLLDSPPRTISSGIPFAVMTYFAGLISKESAFQSIDVDGNGLVSLEEWILRGGDGTEFKRMLFRLDTGGDQMISLTELKPFSLPSEGPRDVGFPHLEIPDPLPRIPVPRIPAPRMPGPRRPPIRLEPREFHGVP